MEKNNNQNLNSVIQQFSRNVGLFEKLFGSKDVMVFNPLKEKYKTILATAYGKRDVFEVLAPEVDDDKITRTLEIMFRVPQINQVAPSQPNSK